MRQKKRKAVFLDRDGIINQKPQEHDYVKSWKEFKFIPGIEELIKAAKEEGYLVIVITNQRGIARGLVSREVVEKIHEKMVASLKKKGAIIDAIYYCPHDIKDHCNCRKPKPGMILQAAKEFNIDLKNSIVIGDSESDIMAGKAVGCKTFLANPDSINSSPTSPLYVKKILSMFFAAIEKDSRGKSRTSKDV